MINLSHKYDHFFFHNRLPPNQLTMQVKSDHFSLGNETIINSLNLRKPNSPTTSRVLEYFAKAPDFLENLEITIKLNNKENLRKLTYFSSMITLIFPEEKKNSTMSIILTNPIEEQNLELKSWMWKSLYFINNNKIEDIFPNVFFTILLFV
jgi:hypothetical protein